MIKINCFDHVQFRLSSSDRRTIRLCQTDKGGHSLESEDIVFHTQGNRVNYFRKEFSELGMYHYSIPIDHREREKSKRSDKALLTILVLPQICFHYKSIGKNRFNDKVIFTTNNNDVVIWEFDKAICHDVINLHPKETLDEVLSCDHRATVGRNRRCLAVYCKDLPFGASFFANPGKHTINQGMFQKKLFFRFSMGC